MRQYQGFGGCCHKRQDAWHCYYRYLQYVWYHGVFTYNNGIGKWYLNGELVTTANIGSRGTSLTISNLSIGNSFTGTTWDTEFYGNISDFRLYSKCLSAEDVKALYNVSASIDKAGVLSAYEFVEEG